MSTATETAPSNGKKSLGDVAKVSEMKQLGWEPVEKEDGTWFAEEIAGDKRTVGPAKNISALHTQVNLASGKPAENGKAPKTVKVPAEKVSGQQPILTGTENAVFADMTAIGEAYRKTTVTILELQAQQDSQKKSLHGMMKKFRDQLVPDPDGKINGKGFVVEVDGERVFIGLETEEVEKVKTHIVKN